MAETPEFHMSLLLHRRMEEYGTYQEELSQEIPFCEPQQWICLQGGKNPSEPVPGHQEAASGRPKDLKKEG